MLNTRTGPITGMASGISGTVRFAGLVVGIAALGAILYDRVAVSVADALPKARLRSSARISDPSLGQVTTPTATTSTFSSPITAIAGLANLRILIVPVAFKYYRLRF